MNWILIGLLCLNLLLLVWLLLHKDSPWDAFASHPRLGCTSQQATVLRTLENLYAEQERHQDPLLSALLVEQLGFYLRRLLQNNAAVTGPDALVTILRAVAQTADEREKELLGTDEF